MTKQNKDKYKAYKDKYTKERYVQICARFRKDDPTEMAAHDFIKSYGVKNFMRTGYTVLRQLNNKEDYKDVKI